MPQAEPERKPRSGGQRLRRAEPTSQGIETRVGRVGLAGAARVSGTPQRKPSSRRPASEARLCLVRAASRLVLGAVSWRARRRRPWSGGLEGEYAWGAGQSAVNPIPKGARATRWSWKLEGGARILRGSVPGPYLPVLLPADGARILAYRKAGILQSCVRPVLLSSGYMAADVGSPRAGWERRAGEDSAG